MNSLDLRVITSNLLEPPMNTKNTKLGSKLLIHVILEESKSFYFKKRETVFMGMMYRDKKYNKQFFYIE